MATMIKHYTPDVVYVCDYCVREMPGLAIVVFYPYGHCNDSAGGASHFCSDECLMAFQRNVTARYGRWKSEPIEERLRDFQEDARPYSRTRESTWPDQPKARKRYGKFQRSRTP